MGGSLEVSPPDPDGSLDSAMTALAGSVLTGSRGCGEEEVRRSSIGWVAGFMPSLVLVLSCTAGRWQVKACLAVHVHVVGELAYE